MKHRKYLSPDDGGLGAVMGGAATLNPWGAAVSAIPALYQFGAGLFQNAKAKRMAKTLHRPTLNLMSYQIPKEVQDYLNMTNNRIVNTTLPGQAQIENRLGAVTANAASDASAAGTSSDALQTIANVYGNQMDKENELGIKAADTYQNNVDNKNADIAQALQTMAGFKDKKFGHDLDKQKAEFDYNQNQPYQEKAAAISALLYGSNKNIYGGLDSLSNIGSALLRYKGNKGNHANHPSGQWLDNRVPSASAPQSSDGYTDLFGASGYGY